MTQDEIDRLAAIEDAELGLDTSKLKFRKVYNSTIPDVRAIRTRLGVTQGEFSRRFRLSERTIQQWEQERTKPDQPSRILLRAIAMAPDLIERAAAIEDTGSLPMSRKDSVFTRNRGKRLKAR
jgi:DNA-binding transcriptional regulator YiaG